MLFSVIIPTYQRCKLVLEAVCALEKQEFDGDFEVVVVVDGSNDGSREALNALVTSFPLEVLVQPNRGRASAVNRGADVANGELLLFLDDDMMADPSLLEEHWRSHREGADIVFGHIPLHPESPRNFLSRGVGYWADGRCRALSAPDMEIPLHEWVTGQVSLPTKIFEESGGFDTVNFTRGGTFGNEDMDFCYRMKKSGYRAVFNPRAISWQKYIVQPCLHLQRWRQVGHADVRFARKYPELTAEVFSRYETNSIGSRVLYRPMTVVPWLSLPLMRVANWSILKLAGFAPRSRLVSRLFSEINSWNYWQGVREAGGMLRSKTVCVLSYHSIASLPDASAKWKPYIIEPKAFEKQVDILLKRGYQFVDGDEFVRGMKARTGLPRKALLLTFDDCFSDLAENVVPILARRHIPAIAFAVSGYLGVANEWDRDVGDPTITLLDAEGLKYLQRSNMEIGAHSRTHPYLASLNGAKLDEEIAGSSTDLEHVGLPKPRFFAYPYGCYNDEVLRAAERSGIDAAFTTNPGVARAGKNMYLIPRVEISSKDVGIRFRQKLFFSGWLDYAYHRLKAVAIDWGKSANRRFNRLGGR